MLAMLRARSSVCPEVVLAVGTHSVRHEIYLMLELITEPTLQQLSQLQLRADLLNLLEGDGIDGVLRLLAVFLTPLDPLPQHLRKL